MNMSNCSTLPRLSDCKSMEYGFGKISIERDVVENESTFRTAGFIAFMLKVS